MADRIIPSFERLINREEEEEEEIIMLVCGGMEDWWSTKDRWKIAATSRRHAEKTVSI